MDGTEKAANWIYENKKRGKLEINNSASLPYSNSSLLPDLIKYFTFHNALHSTNLTNIEYLQKDIRKPIL